MNNLPKNINERLDACLSESNDAKKISSAIMYEFKMHELEKIIAHLIIAYDKAPNLLHEFWQRSSDACPLEAIDAEHEEKEWFKWIYKTIRGI